jgi:outer membrane protein OmpA-like peptidoglycan-associated protein
MWKFLLPLGLVGLGVLAWACTGMHVPTIETDLTSRTSGALAAAGIAYKAPAGITFRDGTNVATVIAHLKGYKGSREISAEAQQIAKNVYGVAGVVVEEIPRPVQDEVKEQITEVLKLENVEFISGKSIMTDKGKATLDKIAGILGRIKDPVEIQGHTDSSGSAVKNRTLSQQRADATRTYLVTKGIAAARLTPVGYGPDKPIADNATAEGRQRNRRIEFSLKEVVINKAN